MKEFRNVFYLILGVALILQGSLQSAEIPGIPPEVKSRYEARIASQGWFRALGAGLSSDPFASEPNGKREFTTLFKERENLPEDFSTTRLSGINAPFQLTEGPLRGQSKKVRYGVSQKILTLSHCCNFFGILSSKFRNLRICWQTFGALFIPNWSAIHC